MQGPFFDAALSYLRTAAMIAAVKLRLFEHVGTEGKTIAALAQLTGSDPRGIRILCEAMQAMGFLELENDVFRMSAQMKSLVGSPASDSLLGTIQYLAGPELVRQIMFDPESYVRSGGRKEDSVLAVDHAVWDVFARSMVPLAQFTAKRLVNYIRASRLTPAVVLDIAAGHGYYGIEIGAAFPDARVTGLDWPEVIRHAAQNARENGLGDRYTALAGSAFTAEWGGPYDTILMVNFLHHFGTDEIVTLLQRAREYLAPDGQIHIVDFIPGRSGPDQFQSLFSFWMLATTPGGEAHSMQAIGELAEQSGFRVVAEQALKPTNQSVISLQHAAKGA